MPLRAIVQHSLSGLIYSCAVLWSQSITSLLCSIISFLNVCWDEAENHKYLVRSYFRNLSLAQSGLCGVLGVGIVIQAITPLSHHHLTWSYSPDTSELHSTPTMDKQLVKILTRLQKFLSFSLEGRCAWRSAYES